MEAQLEYVHVTCMFFARLDADLYAQSVRIDNISASELRRKFIKSALLVGHVVAAEGRRRQKPHFFVAGGWLSGTSQEAATFF